MLRNQFEFSQKAYKNSKYKLCKINKRIKNSTNEEKVARFYENIHNHHFEQSKGKNPSTINAPKIITTGFAR